MLRVRNACSYEAWMLSLLRKYWIPWQGDLDLESINIRLWLWPLPGCGWTNVVS